MGDTPINRLPEDFRSDAFGDPSGDASPEARAVARLLPRMEELLNSGQVSFNVPTDMPPALGNMPFGVIQMSVSGGPDVQEIVQEFAQALQGAVQQLEPQEFIKLLGMLPGLQQALMQIPGVAAMLKQLAKSHGADQGPGKGPFSSRNASFRPRDLTFERYWRFESNN